MVLALAVVHHLAIGKNIPFESIAKMFSLLGNCLLIEFVPKSDEKVQLMLQQKKDVYFEYTEEKFLAAFEIFFSISKKSEIGTSGRTLYLFKKNA